ncbi:hypothetical protein Fmac_004609 [Flemingia macrophylla]|uniref:Uncharacterized protein n=1 Tax=Flemingia macrophylla TaxID=520843 RepID=A0ABD1N5E7_9FABA
MLDVPTQEMERLNREIARLQNTSAAKDAELKKVKADTAVEIQRLKTALKEAEATRDEAVAHLTEIKEDLDAVAAEKMKVLNELERLEAEDVLAREEEKANIVLVEHQGGFDHAIRLVKHHHPNFDTSIFDMEMEVHKGQLMKVTDIPDEDEENPGAGTSQEEETPTTPTGQPPSQDDGATPDIEIEN